VVTLGRKFPSSKRAGRNENEPTSSLVKNVEKPTGWSEGEGRWMGAGITEVAAIDSPVAGMACSRRFTAQCWDLSVGARRPPSAASKAMKAQRLQAGGGGVHSTDRDHGTTSLRSSEGTLLL